MKVRLVAAGAALLMASPPAVAAPTYIHAGRLIAVPGKAVRGPSTIIVENGRITGVQDGFVAPAAGASVVDLRSRTVLPGLIDSHVHLRSDSGGREALIEVVEGSVPKGTLRTAFEARKTLLAGFTTVRNLGDGSGATLALRDMVAEGMAVGPRIVDAGRSISTTGGHMDPRNGLNPEFHPASGPDNVCDGPESCRRAVRLQIGRGADVIKIATTGGVNSGTGRARMAFDDEVKALVDTAHMYGRKIAVHAHGAQGIRAAVLAGADSIEHGTEMDDEIIRLVARSGVYYVPTLSTVNGYLERLAKNPNAYEPKVLEQIRWRIGITGRSLQRAYPAGVKIAFGTDAGVSKHGRNADEFELMVKYGMPPAEAIKAATVNAADLLGLSAEIGTIEPGKSADIIAVAGDPLQDVTVLKTVDFVMARGEVVKGGN
jgi:imidazolonepropionase-like amidohydrolase